MSETEITSKTISEDKFSNIAGVSVRAWLALLFAGGVVGTHLLVTAAAIYHAIATNDLAQVGALTSIGEPLATLSGIAIGFYFGQKLK